MNSEGFFFDELSDLKKDLLREAAKVFPKETEKFLRQEGQKLTNIQKRIAKQDVGTSKGQKKDWNEKKSYHKRFKTGKVYDYSGDKCIRAFNSSPHGHLIEFGHKTQNGKFVPGRYVIKSAENEFKNDFEKDCDEFLSEYFDDIGNHK